MSLTATVTRSYTMIEGAVPSVDDWNTAFEPQVSILGSVGTGDIEDGAVTFPKLAPDLLLAGLNAITQVEGTDILLVGDGSESANSTITVANFWSSVQTAGTVATAFDDYTADTISWFRADTATVQKSTIAYFAESLINQAPVIAEATSTADGVLITNASAAAGSRAQLVDLDSLLPPVITAGTYAFPSSISVRADGRVTAIASTTGNKNTVAGLAIPATNGGETPWDHLLGARPRHIDVTIVCVNASAGYTTGEELDYTALFILLAGAGDHEIPLTIQRTTTQVIVRAPTINTFYIAHKTTGAWTPVTSTDWTLSIEVTI